MSGIAGTYYLSGHPAVGEEVGRMVHKMAHRGPDGVGVWSDGAVGMGHCALHVTPESLYESQPLASNTGHTVLTADLRLDNREDLIESLGVKPSGDGPITDAEIVLAAYEKWGEECVSELLGDFALAIWDTQKQKLYLARDHFGVKQLYYVHVPGVMLAFASEPKALLALPQVSEDLNEVYLANLLALNLRGLDLETTIHCQVKRVPPAHVITTDGGSFRKRRYWSLEKPEELRLGSDEEYAEAFREVFQEAVRCRMRSAFPVATELSGGLDSSFVACLARDHGLEKGLGPVHAISLTFENFPATDERAFIEEVLATGGFTSHFIPASEIGPLSSLEEVCAFMDDPSWFGGTHAYMHRRMRVASETGSRVLLTGYDGDSVVGTGYERFTELAEANRWEEFSLNATLLARRLAKTSLRHSHHDVMASPTGALRAYGEPVIRRWAVEGRYIRFAKAVHQISTYYGLRQRNIYRALWRTLLTPPWAQASSGAEGAKSVADLPGVPLLNKRFVQRTGVGKAQDKALLVPPSQSAQDRRVAFFNSSKPAYTLEGMGLNGAGVSIEPRHPFLDKRVVEFCAALPSEQRFKNGWSRIIQRRAMDHLVPDAVRWRVGKARVTAPFLHGLLSVDRDRLIALTENLGGLEEYVDVSAVQALRDEVLETQGASRPSRVIALLGHIAAVGYWYHSIRGKRRSEQGVQAHSV